MTSTPDDRDLYPLPPEPPMPQAPPPLPQWPGQQPQQYAPVPVQPLEYATPVQYAPQDDLVWREGNQLIIRKNTALPERCVKCNAPGEGRRWRKTLYWHHPAFLVLALLNLLIYAIVALCIREKTKVEASLCRVHRRRRTRAVWVGWLTGLLGIAVFIGGFVLLSDRRTEDYSAFAILAGVVLMLAGLFYGMYVGRILYPKRIDRNFAWLGGCGPAFLANFPSIRR